MNPSEVRDKSADELKKLSLELEEEVFKLKFRKKAGQLQQTANIKKARRDLARVNTIMRERELKAAKEVR